MAVSLLSQAILTALLSNLTSVQHWGETVSSTISPTVESYVYANASHGVLRGKVRYSKTNVQLRVFLGIPFANAPTGDLRFKRPQPPSNWSAVRDATRFGSECVQADVGLNTRSRIDGYPVSMSEDCLYLNIFSPSANGAGPLPVMVWIHGGGYYLGAGSSVDPSELASRGVVVVTINYRLNVFGFFSTGDNAAPGNYGMLDQIMALKWVQQNIRVFGGDPSKVTIFGQSAGASSVSLLTLSPLAAGLFQRAIMESGSALSPFAISHDTARITQKSIAQLTGGRLGCLQTDSKSLIKCLRTVDAETLLNASKSIQEISTINMMYQPRVERVYGFLPEHPYSLLRNGKYNDVDCIIGFNRVELAFLDKENIGATYDVFEKMVNSDINGDYVISDRQIMYDKIKDVYLQNHTDPYFIREQIQKFRSDFYFSSPSLVEIGLRSRTPQSTNQYLYDFTYLASGYDNPAWASPRHGAEIPFVFGLDVGKIKLYGYASEPTSQDRQVAELVQGAWLNFAKYGNPSKTIPVGNDKWIPFTEAVPTYLNISLTSTMMQYNRQRETNLFKELLFKLDTYTSTGSQIIG